MSDPLLNDPNTQGDSDVRAIDPNIAQSLASDPEQSVWVNASAGTGKTKVLTDRVLRLLLPRADGSPGTAIHRILCLTFTKAAASEMMIRIQDSLGRWAIMDEGDEDTPNTLRYELKHLLNRQPSPKDVNAARQVFAEVLESPNGMQIMTIHAFCQSLLGRFPLEAGLTPYFKPLEEEQKRDYVSQAIQTITMKARAEITSDLGRAHHNLSAVLNDQQLQDLMYALMSEASELKFIQKTYFSGLGLYEFLCQHYGFQTSDAAEDIIAHAFSGKHFPEDDIKKCCRILAASKTKTDQQNAAALSDFLAKEQDHRLSEFPAYSRVFLTAEDKVKAKLVSKAIAEKHPDIHDIMDREAGRMFALHDRIKCLHSVQYTRDLFVFGLNIYDEYQSLKENHAVLDFDDLILKSLDLLRKDMMAWVLYKLDQALEHILIDEAQDTNPEQWQIIKALCDEFFAGKGAFEENDYAGHARTLFTVGDHKQSIYSFQRASPEEFERMQHYFADKITKAEQRFQTISLNVSFRTTQMVLDIVDDSFAPDHMKTGMGSGEISHHSFRIGQAGHVELWPICATKDQPEREPWTLPIHVREQESGSSELAKTIASTIRKWMDEKLFLPSRNRAIRPGDIMILVRTRTKLFDQIARELRKNNIPLSGTDRIILNNQIAVHDLISAANFALLPQDDYTLACLLKSPLIGLSEEELFELCNQRPADLWANMLKMADGGLITYLKTLIKNARTMDSFSFFSWILFSSCPNNARSGLSAFCQRLGDDVADDLEEFLKKSMDYTQDQPIHLQHFVHKMKSDQSDVKRSQEERSNKVQIMTIHGSKGLQAPVIILPDTLRTPGGSAGNIDRRVLWGQKTGLSHPLWSPKKNFDHAEYTRLRKGLNDREDEEYKRLLYVAMTRAEDRLYIAGHAGKNTPDEKSWYYAIKTAMEHHRHAEVNAGGVITVTTPQIKRADREDKNGSTDQRHIAQEHPDFLDKNATEETPVRDALSPSKILDDEDVYSSPLFAQDKRRFRRGNITHKLLEVLPQIPPKTRKNAAKTYLNHFAADLSEDIRSEIINETLNIIENDEYKSIFGPNSRFEVPITAVLADGTTINGQIDRLLIEKEDIRIIDYKTNRPPPRDSKDVPKIYVEQLRAYKNALRQIYPHHRFHCALLWTDGPFLMPIDV